MADKRKAKEINAEKATLYSCKEKIAALAPYGKQSEDQIGAVEAQITTIEEDLDDGDIENLWTPGSGQFDRLKDSFVLNAAKDARRWLDGENDLAPSLRWLAVIEDIEG